MPTTTAVARERARNTLLQGLTAAVVIGAGSGALDVLHKGTFTWATVGTAALTGAISSVVAYMQHAYAAPYLRIRRGKVGHGDAP